MTNKDLSVIENDEIDLLAVWKIIWRGKITLIIFTLVFIVLSVSYALYLPNIYRADVTLFPNLENSQPRGSNLNGGLKGIASLAGVNIGTGGNSKTVLALEILKSRKFISNFIKEHDLLLPLFALKKWNEETGIETYDDQIYDVKQNKWLIDPDTKKSMKPTDLEAFEEFIQNLKITPDIDTGIVIVSFDFISPVKAKSWVDFLVEDLNKVVRDKDVLLANRSIIFLEKQLEKTRVVDVQKIFFRLIENQIQKKLLAETMEEYIFETIDPAVIAEVKIGPKRALICILGTILGGLLGLFTVFVRNPRKR